MFIWLSLIFPLIAAIIMLIWFKRQATWWEIFIPFAVSFVAAVIVKYTTETIQVSDTEYWGGLGVRAQYYEPYETWVEQECSRQVPCGTETDSKGNTTTKYCTEYYDCSYCDDYPAAYYLVDDQEQKFRISESYYNSLAQRWKSSPTFIELGRSIEYHWGCGKDGDLYEVYWDGQPLTSEATNTHHTYENRVQAAHSAFDFPEITEEEKAMYRLYDYPEIQGYYQSSVLGEDSISWITPLQKYQAGQQFNYLNGYWGPRKQAKVWVLLFKDQPALAAKMQEAYWKGGNKNELVICIGLSSQDSRVLWVSPFSWTPNRQLLVDLRRDIMEVNNYDPNQIYSVVNSKMDSFERKHFKEFSYLTVEPPTWVLILFLSLSAIFTAFVSWWAITNEFESK